MIVARTLFYRGCCYSTVFFLLVCRPFYDCNNNNNTTCFCFHWKICVRCCFFFQHPLIFLFRSLTVILLFCFVFFFKASFTFYLILYFYILRRDGVHDGSCVRHRQSNVFSSSHGRKMGRVDG